MKSNFAIAALLLFIGNNAAADRSLDLHPDAPTRDPIPRDLPSPATSAGPSGVVFPTPGGGVAGGYSNNGHTATIRYQPYPGGTSWGIQYSAPLGGR